MEFDIEQFTARLTRQAETIRTLVQGVSDEQAGWRPSPDAWSVLEVINHLYDEEIEDFRQHLDHILHHPAQPWPRIDPQGWVTERQYIQRQIGASLDNFLRERETSLAWLKGLTSPNWEATYAAPFGQIAAGDMLASWVAHDLLHTRQLVELHWAYVSFLAAPHKVDYAGLW
jgi:hypothetical protein